MLTAMMFAPRLDAASERLPVRVGVLTPGATWSAAQEGLEEGLTRLGYSAGKNVVFLIEDTKGSNTDLGARAAKLLSAKPHVLFAVSTEHARAAKQATSTVPIVFAWVGDPVSVGLIESYPYSRSNVTGVTSISDSLSGKRLEVLLEIAPKVKRVLIFVSLKESISTSSFRSLEPAAKKFGIQLIRRDAGERQEIAEALDKMPRGTADAIFFIPSLASRTNLDLLVKRANGEKIPLVVTEEALLDQGAMLSYGPSLRLLGIQAADLVGKILRGAKPGEIRIESPERFFLSINQSAARRIGMPIPQALLARADRLIP